MLEVRRFLPDTDLRALNSLRRKHKLDHVPEKDVPVLGVVVTDQSIVVAMGFLRKCEGNYGIMDSVITNPDILSEKRHEALDMVFQEVIKISKIISVYNLFGFSIDHGMIERSKRFGFKSSNHTVLELAIGGL